MTTNEILRKKAEHSYKIHQMEQDRLNKEKTSFWSWIKREVFFAEKMSNKEFLKLFLGCVLALPAVIAVIWMMFGINYAFGGM